jgi:hypothetical protein
MVVRGGWSAGHDCPPPQAMQDRLNQNDVTNRINVEDPARVRDAVLSLFAARYPATDLAPLAQAFADFERLFAG